MNSHDYDALFAQRDRIKSLTASDNPLLARTAYAALMTVDGHIDPAWELAWGASGRFSNLLAALPLLADSHLRLALAERSLPLLDDESLSLLSGWPERDRLAARKAVIAALVYVPGHEAEIREALETAQQDPALQSAVAAALERIESRPPDERLAPARQVQNRYAMSDVETTLDWPTSSRSFARGRRVYHELGCHRCHVTSKHDTLVGPNLTGPDYKTSRRELAEAIIVPDKQIAENYRQYLLLVNGKPITGLVTEQTDEYLIVIADPMHDCTPQRIERDQLDDEPERLTTSAMPTGMVDVLTMEELLDLLAYVESKGNQENSSFKPLVPR
jgi:putative heme-binding domain-containing protein